MSKSLPLHLATLCSFLLCSAFSPAQSDEQKNLDLTFKSAVAQYEAGNFAKAASQLEDLLPRVPRSFEVHELLGQVYASLAQNEKAIEQLQEAVRLKPDSGAARTNLAAALLHAGKLDLAGEQFRKALQLEPRSYDANHNLGEFCIQSGRLTDAIPLLERAQSIQPASYDNGYDLAQAEFLAGQLGEARKTAQALLRIKDSGELHNLLGQIDEKDGKFVAAANELQIAAQMDPSDDNLFYWGCELLLHRTYDPAIDVFQQASRRYPNSPRLLIGLGMALYARGKYDEAVKTFQPYDKVKEPYPDARAAGTALIVEGERYEPRRKTYIYVNNRLEGNALETISAILESNAD